MKQLYIHTWPLAVLVGPFNDTKAVNEHIRFIRQAQPASEVVGVYCENDAEAVQQLIHAGCFIRTPEQDRIQRQR